MTEEQTPEQTEQKPQEPQGNPDAKFTQEDVNKIIQERLKDEKVKFDKQIEEQKAEAAKQAELAKMTELERLKAEKDDLAAKFQAEADKNALAIQKDEVRKLMSEKALPDVFLESILVPKNNEETKNRIEKIKNVFDEAVNKAVEAKIPPHVPQGRSNQQAKSGINKDVAQKPWNRFKQ